MKNKLKTIILNCREEKYIIYIVCRFFLNLLKVLYIPNIQNTIYNKNNKKCKRELS